MQTPAERQLITELKEIVSHNPEARLLNIGAAKSLVIEQALYEDGRQPFHCDRLDIENSQVTHPVVENCYQASVEAMTDVRSGFYDAAFANYVLEHVANLSAAVLEISRILKPGGLFVLSTPNPAAPEFKLSHHTPLWFHQLIKGEGDGKRAYETVYAYKNIADLIKIFEAHGFHCLRIMRISFTEGYLYRFPVINVLSRIYDKVVTKLKINFLMGNVCLVFQKINS